METASLHSKHGIFHPPPTDFDAFLPWACMELSVEIDIVIVRILLKPHSTVATDRPKKDKRTKSRAATMSSSSSTDATSILREFAKSSTAGPTDSVTIETYYDNNGNLVQLKFMNNKQQIPREVFKIIGLIIPFHKFLNSITINSGLTMESIYEMSKYLNISHITEMILDRTFLMEANYHILLDHTCLKYLSLSKCKINDTVVKTIASKLMYPFPASHKLSALNLATNRISDKGAQYLADVLRTNRKLSYLNLSDNMISDDGAISILKSLMKFVLTEQEIIDSKGRLLQYLKMKNGLISAITKELMRAEQDKKIVKKKVVKPVTTMSLRKSKQLDKELSKELQQVRRSFEKNKQLDKELPKELQQGRKSFEQPFGELRERAASLADCQLGLFSDPFSQDNIYNVGKTTFCYGNNGLCYLNLAYNDLTYASLKVLYEVVVTQRNLVRMPRGLVNVVIEGNCMPTECEELQKIDEILSRGFYTAPRLSVIKKKHSPLKSGDD